MVLNLRTLVLVAAVSVGALTATTVFFLVTEESPSTSSESDDPFDSSDFDDNSRDDNSRLDDLYDACDDGDFDACDDLYYDSPVDSFYEEFGSTCGDRRSETRGSCS